MTTIVIKADFMPEEIRRIAAIVQDIESMRPDELFQLFVDAPDMQGEADDLAKRMRPPALPGYQRTEKRWERSEIEHRQAAIEALREFGNGVLTQDFTDAGLGKIVDSVLNAKGASDE